MYRSIPDSNHSTWRERDRPTDASLAIGEARRSPPAATSPCRSSRHDVRSTHAPQDGAVYRSSPPSRVHSELPGQTRCSLEYSLVLGRTTPVIGRIVTREHQRLTIWR